VSISMKKLLQKMEEEILNAKQSSSETRIRERIQAIKTLCELILDEPEAKQHQFSSKTTVPTATVSVDNPKRVIHNHERLQTDDGANGESLFDF
jgi:sensor domain CHASE-containing protein